jgi:hypothetical protein
MLGKHVPVTKFSVLVGVRLVSVGVRFHVGVPFVVAWFQQIWARLGDDFFWHHQQSATILFLQNHWVMKVATWFQAFMTNRRWESRFHNANAEISRGLQVSNWANGK